MNILIFGLGSIAKKHILAINLIFKNARITALRSGTIKDEVKGVKNIQSLSDLIIPPDFIIISNPTYKHFTAIKEALRFEKPIFIEKPLFNELKDAEELIKEITIKKIKTYVACNLRFLDSIKFVKNYLSSNSIIIQEVNAYCGSYLPNWRPEADYKNSYSANAQHGGGVHLDLIHELDYIYWFFGKPVRSNKKLFNKSGLLINAVDYANYILEYDTFTANIILNYYRVDSKRKLEIIFEKDTWEIDLLSNTITSLVSNEVIFTSKQTISDTYFEQMSYFIDSVQTKVDNMNSIKDAFEVLKICLN
jgi:predicted dehydrogenase